MTVSYIHVDDDDLDLDALTALEVLAAIPGLTYRQLDYWTRSGRVKSYSRRPKARQGVHRQWPLDQILIAKTMHRLINYGIDLNLAHDLATNHEVRAILLAELTKIEAEADT